MRSAFSTSPLAARSAKYSSVRLILAALLSAYWLYAVVLQPLPLATKFERGGVFDPTMPAVRIS
jgi:hypothetical protein